MIKQIWIYIGRILYVLTYPLLALYINKDARAKVAVWHNGEVLLVKSWLAPDKWDLPGGGLYKNEDSAAGAAREVREETSIIISSELLSVGKYRFKQGLINFKCYGYTVKLHKKPVIKMQKFEILDANWFSYEEVIKLPVHRTLKQIINRSKDTLGVL